MRMKIYEIYDKVKYAFQHHEVKELLSGKNEYFLYVSGYEVDLPTCSDMLFKHGIIPLYKKCNKKKKKVMIKQIEKAIRELMRSDDAIEVWWSISLIADIKLFQKIYNSEIFISNHIASEVIHYIKAKEKELNGCMKYAGILYKNGLWGDVKNCFITLEHDYGININ